MRSDNPVWLDYTARTFGISYTEYILMTPGEIQDLSICQAIASGQMTEKPIFEGSYIPTLR